MEISFLNKKHLREISKHRMIQRLRQQTDIDDLDFRNRFEMIELSNIKEVQALEIRNLKEFYVRMLKRESDGLNNHLDMLESLYNMLHRIYIDTMHMKIRGVEEWYKFRVRNDQQMQRDIQRIHQRCDELLNDLKSTEQQHEMEDVKQDAEQQRKQRKKAYSLDSSVAVSSGMVFTMNLSRRNKLSILDDNSSIGTYGLGEGDDINDAFGSAPRNNAFLRMVQRRAASKRKMEEQHNVQIDELMQAQAVIEKSFMEVIRKKERDSLKSDMQVYFKQEVAMEEKIQDSLQYEKNAISALQTRHESELESVMTIQKVEMEKLLQRNTSERLGAKQLRDANLELKIRQNDIMLTAHCFHEIRNVLASILCLGENLKEDPLSIESIIEEQHDVCSYAIETMSDMLSIAKLKEPGFQPNRSPISVSELFDVTIRIQGRRAQTGVTVVKLVEDESIQIFSDKRLLLQLFVNLLSNAAKFTTAGTIALWAARRTDLDENTSDVILGVVDTGKGFDLPRMKRVTTRDSGEGDLSKIDGFVDDGDSQVSANIAEYHTSGYKARNTGYGLYLASTVSNALKTKLKVQSPVPEASLMPRLPPNPGSFFYLLQPELSHLNKTFTKFNTRTQSTILRAQNITDRQKASSRDVHTGEIPKICDVTTTTSLSQTARECVRDSIKSEAEKRSQWVFKPAGHIRFLIVDDQKLLRQAMIIVAKNLCERHEGLTMHVETACSAEEALRKHLNKGFDLISLDQFYDSILISHSTCLMSTEEYPCAEFVYGQPTENKTNYVQLKTKEAFRMMNHDGALLGTDVIAKLRQTSTRPIVFSCTASDNIDAEVVMMKPYSVTKLEETLTQHMPAFQAQQVIYQDDNTMRKKTDLILYQRS